MAPEEHSTYQLNGCILSKQATLSKSLVGTAVSNGYTWFAVCGRRLKVRFRQASPTANVTIPTDMGPPGRDSEPMPPKIAVQ